MTQELDLKARRRTIYLWIETGVVLLACVAPLIYGAVEGIFVAPRGGRLVPFVFHAFYSIVGDVGIIAVVLFIIWRSGDPPGRFGLKRFHIGRDLFGGLAIYGILLGMYLLLWWSLRTFLSRPDYLALVRSGVGAIYRSPSGSPEFILLAPMCLLSAFSQELVVRVYLIIRFEELIESLPLALLLSTLLFMCGHIYQGMGGVIWSGVFGLIQGVIFCRFRRLTPIAIAHALNNYIVIGHVIRF